VSLSLFLVDALPAGDAYTLDGPEGHHAADVQRLRVGEHLMLGDGRGGLASATVRSVGRGYLDLGLDERTVVAAPQPRLVVVQGIAKGDRGELAVQAMTEVGVDEIVPWAAARSVARWQGPRPHERWIATAREAAKQARRAWVPVVSSAASTAEVATRLRDSALSLVLHEDAKTALSTVELPTDGDLVLVIGPEGGITDDELAAFAAAGAVPVRLGPEVLRTSTAGVAAIAALAPRLGRW
jgi:16S rRNA (uracil1498-N3)-methyltransferase